MAQSEELKLIDSVVKSFTKEFGEGSAGTLSSEFKPENVHGFVPTGNLALDWVIGRPGWPLGRISEIAGPYGSGKSTMVARTIGAAQKSGVVCILVDTEHSYDSTWATEHGVNPEKLILLQPPHLQGVFDYIKSAIVRIKELQSAVPVFIAVDSVSGSATASEIESEDSTEGKQRAEHAKIISEGLRKLSNLIWDQNVALVFVSQLKDNPGIMYGTNKSKIGGHAIEFHASLMVEARRKGYLKEQGKDTTYGQSINVSTVKNKFVPPFRTRTFDLYFNEGLRPKEILLEFISDEALFNPPLVKKGGGWYEAQGSKYRMEDMAAALGDDLQEYAYQKLNLRPPYARRGKEPEATTSPSVEDQNVVQAKDITPNE